MRVAVAYLLIAAACGDDGGSVGDAGDVGAADADASPDAGLAIAPPAPPMAPTIACADGFGEVSWDGVTACAPFDGGAQQSCGDGEAHLIGTEGCAPIGSPCPADEWPADVPAGAVYVRPGATGGDGTRASPYGTIEEALRRGLGTTVALAKGTYGGQLALQTRTTLIGACAAETILTTSAVSLRGTVAVDGDGVVLRDLSIADASSPGVVVAEGADVRLEGVAIHRAAGAGLTTDAGAGATADRLLIRDMNEIAGQAGRGVAADAGSEVTLTNVSIENVHNAGILVNGDGARVMASRIVIRGVDEARLDAGVGYGALAQDGSSLALAEVYLEDTFDAAVAGNLGATVDLRDVTIVEVTGREDAGGIAVFVQTEVELVGERVFLQAATHSGLAALGPSTTVALRDFVVAETGGASLLNRGGVYLIDVGASVLERGVITRNELAGLFVQGESSAIDVTDVSILDGSPTVYGGLEIGRGIYVHLGATVNLRRVAVDRAIDTAILATHDGTVLGEDVTVRDVRPPGRDVPTGRGVQAQLGSRVSLTRALVEGTAEGAILAVNAGTVLELTDVVATDSASAPCEGAPGCLAAPGMLLASVLNADVRATRFLFSRGATCGVLVAADGAMTLRDGTVSENPIGACIQVDGFDVSTLMDGVRYADNEVNLQITMLPLPGALGGIEME